MKKLTRMKLINWHRFTDTTIRFGDSTLLSGENGSGKSTLLDAIQFVVTCSANHFNKAAHENGKRKLTGYIRYKTGEEHKPYERTGEISAHIALEFYEESKNRYFVLGVVIDSATEGQETVARYLMDNTMFSNDMFMDGKRPRNITEFRTYNNASLKHFVKTQAEAKKIIKQRFGRIEDKFFQLIPKALAFKPIDDIKDFVYSYVLDEKEVNIDSLRENVRSYQDLEKTLEGVKKRIEKLKEIEEQYKIVKDCMASDSMYDYFLAKSEVDINKETVKALEQQILKAGFSLEELVKERKQLEEEWQAKNEIYTNLLVELKQNKEFQALEEQQKRLDKLREDERNQQKEVKAVRSIADDSLKLTHKLTQLPNMDSSLSRYTEVLRNLDSIEDIGAVQTLVQEVIGYKKSLVPKFQQEMLEKKSKATNLRTELLVLEDKIKKLERQTFSYPPEVEYLKSKIEQKFVELGRNAEIHVLCELLELAQEKWRKAVEGYLNTQRFYLLVEPEHFDVALSIYDSLKKDKRTAGVGLINTAKLEAFTTTPEGSLASVVTTGNLYAKRYINLVLGKVVLCERSEDLKKHQIAITPEGMRYQNHVASLLKPRTYDPPYIGNNALKIQLEQYKVAKAKALEEKTTLEKEVRVLEGELELLEIDSDLNLKLRLPVLQEIKRTRIAVKECQETINTLKENSDFMAKQFQAEEIKKETQKLNGKISAKDQELGSLKTRSEVAKESLSSAQKEGEGLLGRIDELKEAAGMSLERWEAEYAKQTRDKSYERFRTNFDRRKKGNLTIQETARSKMTSAMVAYKTAFDFGAPATFEAYPEYGMIYDRLVHSELLSYENKVTKARMSAEEEFREQFLSKLQENMKQAQSEFKELNKALKGIVFSNERYEFLHLASKKYSKYYDMIMDDFNVAQGESIFAGAFHENHKEVIDELFTRLALDQENTAKTLEEFTDYRTYMDYDIKIIHESGSYSLYSKVCEEKSGGETQTPFYVTVAASFVQLYSNNIGGEALGLVMFDEAFNNMDDERIGGVLEFLNRLPLQLIIAAPPDKVQYIGPWMEDTLLVLRDNKESYVEEYRDAALRKENLN